ncbi:MAG: MotA/TolQ/ExbB proton channel family protein [Candidatus Rokubacteria bacterium]|nr:MotA/TolQ/ExbB proton channel family protein [Candidatus Rokubacteria bacterium]
MNLSYLGSFGELVANAGLIAKFVLLVLFVLSVVCWAIIFHKAMQFRAVRRETARFLKVYRESRRFAVVAGGAKRLRASPLARLYLGAYQELGGTGNPLPDLMDGPPDEGEDGIATERLESVQRAMRRVQSSELERMEGYLAFLATTASSGPFIGLFGTVWGIMTSFHSIGSQGSASLAVVAPGIAEALIATAAGLAAAIPAVVGYNYFVGKVRHWATEMENFGLELANLLERRLLRATVKSLKNGY